MTSRAGVDTGHRRLYLLVALALLMSVGHHIDHMIRGNNVGWPIDGQVNAFTYSLVIYPLLLIGWRCRAAALGLAQYALRRGVAIVPGPLLAANDQFDDHIRASFGPSAG